MRARIFQPSRSAMQSGVARTRRWVLEYAPLEPGEIDPLMGWTGSGDTRAQVRIGFDTREEAEAYAQARGLEVTVRAPTRPAHNVRKGGYGENFATGRKGTWTH